MNDKEYAAEKKRVRKYLDKWKGTLGLGAHKLNIEWHRERDEEESQTAIRCTNSWQYRLITLNVFLPVCKEQMKANWNTL